MRNLIQKIPKGMWLCMTLIGIPMALVTSTVSLGIASANMALYVGLLLGALVHDKLVIGQKDYTHFLYVAFIGLAAVLFPAAIFYKSAWLYALSLIALTTMPVAWILQREQEVQAQVNVILKSVPQPYPKDDGWTTPWVSPTTRYFK